jgi:DNA-binding transcriptional regulator YdaS (Cro superfamily)
MSRDALSKACEAVGGQTALSEAIRVRQSTLWYWLHKAKRGVPAEHVIDVERATGISRHELRPDLYPREAPSSERGAA